MPDKPNRQTAQKIQETILSLEMFFFLAKENFTVSRWCPCEIGHADGVKDVHHIPIVPHCQRPGNTMKTSAFHSTGISRPPHLGALAISTRTIWDTSGGEAQGLGRTQLTNKEST